MTTLSLQGNSTSAKPSNSHPCAMAGTKEAAVPPTFHVLLVDDDALCSLTVGQLLVKIGHYRVTRSSSVKDALRLLDAGQGSDDPFDLVLTDLVMPEETSGFDIVNGCRSAGHNLPVVVMSSYSNRDTMDLAFKYGAADYLVKPIRRNDAATLWQHVWRHDDSSLSKLLPGVSDSDPASLEIVEKDTNSGVSTSLAADDEDQDSDNALGGQTGRMDWHCKGGHPNSHPGGVQEPGGLQQQQLPPRSGSKRGRDVKAEEEGPSTAAKQQHLLPATARSPANLAPAVDVVHVVLKAAASMFNPPCETHPDLNPLDPSVHSTGPGHLLANTPSTRQGSIGMVSEPVPDQQPLAGKENSSNGGGGSMEGSSYPKQPSVSLSHKLVSLCHKLPLFRPQAVSSTIASDASGSLGSLPLGLQELADVSRERRQHRHLHSPMTGDRKSAVAKPAAKSTLDHRATLLPSDRSAFSVVTVFLPRAIGDRVNSTLAPFGSWPLPPGALPLQRASGPDSTSLKLGTAPLLATDPANQAGSIGNSYLAVSSDQALSSLLSTHASGMQLPDSVTHFIRSLSSKFASKEETWWPGTGTESVQRPSPQSSSAVLQNLQRAASSGAIPTTAQAAAGVAPLSYRAEAVVKYLAKRNRRVFHKKVRYESRKRLAEARPRVRGQFVKQVHGDNTISAAGDAAAASTPPTPSHEDGDQEGEDTAAALAVLGTNGDSGGSGAPGSGGSGGGSNRMSRTPPLTDSKRGRGRGDMNALRTQAPSSMGPAVSTGWQSDRLPGVTALRTSPLKYGSCSIDRLAVRQAAWRDCSED